LLARPAGRGHQAPALRRRGFRRHRAGNAAFGGAASPSQWRRDADAARRGAVDRAGAALRPAGRHARAGRCGRPDRGRSRLSVGGARGGHPLALEEHLLRGRAPAWQGLANAGRRPHSLRAGGLTAGLREGKAAMTTTILIALALGYLLGSIPFGLLITRAAGLGDVRKIGSGNIGATIVLRTGNKGLAAATLLCDALKGTVAALIAANWGVEAGIAAGF